MILITALIFLKKFLKKCKKQKKKKEKGTPSNPLGSYIKAIGENLNFINFSPTLVC